MSERKENLKAEAGKIVDRESVKGDDEFAFNLVVRKLVRRNPADKNEPSV